MMNYDDIRTKLLHETPFQFCVYLEMLDREYEAQGFRSLVECLTTSVTLGGVGLIESKIVDMMYYNPDYKHKADKLKLKLGLQQVAAIVPVLNDHGVRHANNEKGISKIGSNSKEYRIAKLKRDHPDVAQRLIDGEFKSVSAAERAAGIGPPLKSEVDKVVTAVNKLTAHEWQQVVSSCQHSI